MQDVEKKGKGWFMEDWIRAVDVWLPPLGIRVSGFLRGQHLPYGCIADGLVHSFMIGRGL